HGGGEVRDRRAVQPEGPHGRPAAGRRGPGGLRRTRSRRGRDGRLQRGRRGGGAGPGQEAGGRLLCGPDRPTHGPASAGGVNSQRGTDMAMVNEWKLKEQICEIGRRVYAKGFAAANDGNITIRLNDREVLCTPTMVSKGFLKPEDICKVDYEGKQL